MDLGPAPLPVLPRRALGARLRGARAPILVLRASAGTGKTWALRQIAAQTGAPLLDHLPDRAAPLTLLDLGTAEGPLRLPEARAGQRWIIACRPGTELPGLGRALLYGEAEVLGDADLLVTEAELTEAGIPPAEAARLIADSGGWACLLPVLAGQRREALARFLQDEVLAPLSPQDLIALDGHLRGTPPAGGTIPPRLPILTDAAGEALPQPLAAIREPLARALSALRAEIAADAARARTLGRAEAAAGQWPEAIATFQRIGALDEALAVLEAAGGPYVLHRYGPAATDRILAGFPPALLAEAETLVLVRAMRAAKRGDIQLCRRILAERWGEAAPFALTMMGDRRHSVQLRVLRFVLRTWEDDGFDAQYLDAAWPLLSELAPDDDLRRGSFFNAVLEFHIRSRRLTEAEHAAARASAHYTRAGVPLLSFYISLHRAIICLLRGDPRSAAQHGETAEAHLAATPHDSPGDAVLLRLLLACIDHDRGRPDPLIRFLTEDLDRLVEGEIWPTLLELALDYGTQALGDRYSTLSARAFLDRWRQLHDRSPRFQRLIDIRDVAALQNANRWAEGAAKAALIGGRVTLAFVLGAPEGTLAALTERDEIALALSWLRHLARTQAGRPGLAARMADLSENPRLTERQRLGLRLWRAEALWRQHRPAEAQALVGSVLMRLADTGAVAILSEERVFIEELMGRRRLARALELDADRAGRPEATPALGPVPPRPFGLTRQEMRLVQALSEGAPNKSIATLMGLSEATIKFHLRNLYRKLGVPGRRAAVDCARREGLVP